MAGNKLYVGNLDFQTTSGDLTELFAGAGQVLSAQVIIDRETQRSKGFAFIEMANEIEALKAISLYNGHLLNERALLVSEARPREDRASGGKSGRSPNATAHPKFREIKHKPRGGRKPRRF
jgi:cold-inducible RNA-binding protein